MNTKLKWLFVLVILILPILSATNCQPTPTLLYILARSTIGGVRIIVNGDPKGTTKFVNGWGYVLQTTVSESLKELKGTVPGSELASLASPDFQQIKPAIDIPDISVKYEGPGVDGGCYEGKVSVPVEVAQFIPMLDGTEHNECSVSFQLSQTAFFKATATVTITASASKLLRGRTINLTVTETNSGNVPLSNPRVNVTSSPASNYFPLPLTKTSSSYRSGDNNGDGILDIGETWTWGITGIVVNNNTTYTATGYGNDPNNSQITTPGSSTSVQVEDKVPGTQVNIAISDDLIVAGSIVDLIVSEKNTGYLDLKNVSVIISTSPNMMNLTLNNLSPSFTSNQNINNILEVGEIWTWTLKSGPLNDSVVFTAIGTGTDPLNNIITYPAYNAERCQTFAAVYQPPSILTPPILPDGCAGVPYHQQLIALNGLPPYHWNIIEQTSMPDGLKLNPSTGVIEGITTHGTSQINFKVRVTDADGNICDEEFSIKIVLLMITTDSLPEGKVDAPYFFTLEAAGGVPPYKWVKMGTLPAGLSFNQNGTISGVPTEVATKSVSFQVIDTRYRSSQTKVFTIKTTLGTENYTPEWRKNIQPGDILLSRSSGFTSSLLTWIGNYWTHAGIYAGDGKVIEAVKDDCSGKFHGVIMTNITTWDHSATPSQCSKTCVGLLRVNGTIPTEFEQVINFVNSQIGKPYGLWPHLLFDFKREDFTAPDWYCSELIWAAYRSVGIDIEEGPDIWYVFPDEIFDDEDTYIIGTHKEYVPGYDELIPLDYLIFYVRSPNIVVTPNSTGSTESVKLAELIVIDPDGLVISQGLSQIPESLYLIDDFDNDGSPEVVIGIPNSKIGDYRIKVISADYGGPLTGTYSIETGLAGQRINLIGVSGQECVVRSNGTGIRQIAP